MKYARPWMTGYFVRYQEVGLLCFPRTAMKAKLNAAFVLLTMMGLFCIPAHAQLASYLDDQGNLVYTNSMAPAPRVTPAKSSSASVSSQANATPQRSSAPAPALTQGLATTTPSVLSAASSAAAPSQAPAQPLIPVISAPAELDQMVQQTAEKHNVDPALVRAVISTESNWNASAVSSKGAQGLMQLVPGTAHQLGVGNAFDPAQNVDAGVRYLGMLLQTVQWQPKACLGSV